MAFGSVGRVLEVNADGFTEQHSWFSKKSVRPLGIVSMSSGLGSQIRYFGTKCHGDCGESNSIVWWFGGFAGPLLAGKILDRGALVGTYTHTEEAKPG
jgi:hypothetical protein